MPRSETTDEQVLALLHLHPQLAARQLGMTTTGYTRRLAKALANVAAKNPAPTVPLETITQEEIEEATRLLERPDLSDETKAMIRRDVFPVVMEDQPARSD